MTNQFETIAVQQTMEWIRSFIVKLTICPFAKREVDRGSLRIQASSASSVDGALDDLMGEMKLLDEDVAIETTVLLFPHLFEDFFDYLDFLDKANACLVDEGYEGIYQLASFHPDYCFADAKEDDAANYTNRAPYPMLHILREASVEQAIAYYGNTDEIPEKNIAKLRALGLAQVKKLRDSYLTSVC